MIVLMLCLIAVLLLQYRELQKISKLLQEHRKEAEVKKPPKARGSFVVKRMEERLKEALYE